MNFEEVEMRVGKFIYPVTLLHKNLRTYFKFGFNRGLMAEIKAMRGSRYHYYDPPESKQFLEETFGTSKIWSVLDCPRNNFQIAYLKGENPYVWYERPLVHQTPNRNCFYSHQSQMLDFVTTVRQCILAAEMGTGKTLVAIELIEYAKVILGSSYAMWYVAPKAVLKEVGRQWWYWNCKIPVRFMTYDELTKVMSTWERGSPAPGLVIFDEASRVKNPTANRTQAAQAVADAMRAEYGKEAFIVLMSGSPAPKSPLDWWSLCEIACPGYLREGELTKFQRRLSVLEEGQGLGGQKFSKHKTWLDNPKKCQNCGMLLEDHCNVLDLNNGACKAFSESVDEISKLYRRMKGLVLVQFKKDCVDLPDKRYRIIQCKPSPSVIRAANLITSQGKSAASTLILLRELSDGFQYKDEVTDEETTCEICHGSGQYVERITDDDPNDMNAVWREEKADCFSCGGTGKQFKVIRETVEIATPKEEALRDVLEEYEDHGRLVVYAGFQGSVDRCVRVCLSEGWRVIRCDGRGWHLFTPGNLPETCSDFLKLFQEQQAEFPKVVFVGQPGAAGMGLTLHAACAICYYSSDFNAESRIQSEDRIHRLGMDKQKGATIIDLFHLKTDKLIYDNLKNKRRLQSVTMGQIWESLKEDG